jgi:group I intron endonuclease
MDISFKNKSGIYIIKTKINNRFYIGSAINLYNRMHTHLTHLKKNKHCNAKLQRFVNKYGIENIFFECVELCEKENLIIREQFYIDTLNPFYNIAKIAGSTLGTKITKEQSEKLSKLRKGKQNSLGRKYSKETILKMSESAKKRGLHPNFKEASIKANTGKKQTIEHRAKITEKQKKINNMQLIEIKKMLKEGVFQKEIALKYNVSQRVISKIKLGIY